jgi:hypothetical protein
VQNLDLVGQRYRDVADGRVYVVEFLHPDSETCTVRSERGVSFAMACRLVRAALADESLDGPCQG